MPLNCSFDSNLTCQAKQILDEIKNEEIELGTIIQGKSEHFSYSIYQPLKKVFLVRKFKVKVC
jgi:hypothetical protein